MLTADDMAMSRFDPLIALDREAPTAPTPTAYDRAHMLTYARLLDAEALGHDWHHAAAEILGSVLVSGPEATAQCWNSHLSRAHWLVERGLGDACVENEVVPKQAR